MDGEKGIKIRFLRAKPDEPARLHVFGSRVVTENSHLAGLIIGKACNYIDRRGFARTIRPEKGKKIPALDLKRNIRKRLDVIVEFGEIFYGDRGIRTAHKRDYT